MSFVSKGTGGRFVSKGSGAGFSSKISQSQPTGIVTDNLVAWLDASNGTSYPGSGTTIYDLSGQGADGTINGTVSWTSDGQASYWNFATQSDSNYISSVATANYVDFTIVFEPDLSLVSSYGIVGLLAPQPPNASGDLSLRFTGANGTGPWVGQNPDVFNNGWRSTAGTWYINGAQNTSSYPPLATGWNILGVARDNTVGLFGSPWSYYLGSSAYPSRSFQGKIAVVLLYSVALTQQQHEQNYNALKSRFGL